MAEAFFNKMAKGKARAISAGTQPSKAVNPVVSRAMLDAGIDISNKKPRLLTPEMLDKADRVISMGCLDSSACPAGMAHAEDWRLPDPEGRSLPEVILIRDEIKRRIIELLASLQE
jgi:arsenate reductase